MNIQQIIDELKNIKEQAINDDEITKTSIIEAITDIIHDVEGTEFDFINLNEEDDYASSYEEPDFTKLEIV
jgi:hypothetical protein|tara:strand:- start:1632 stop:1844 length:213 start_codon:yes stop_codon:yes gene_type:complete